MLVKSPKLNSLLAAFFALISLNLDAQQKVFFTPTDIDSLEEVLSDQEGKEKTLTLINLAFAANGVDAALSADYSRKALTEARRMKDYHLMGKACNNLVTFYTQKFDFDSATLYSDTVLTLGSKHNHPDLMVVGYMNKGVINFYKQEKDSALANFTRGIEVSEEHNVLPEKRILLYNNIASVQMQKGKFQEALKSFLNAATAADLINDRASSAQIKGNIGTVYFQMKDLENARKFFEESLILAREVQSKAIISAVTLNLGVICKDTGEPEKALEYFAEARLIKESIGDLSGIGIIYVNEGEIYAERKDYDKANFAYSEAERIGKEVKNPQILLTAYSNQGDILAQKGNFSKANEKYDLAIELAKSQSLVPDLMNIYNAYSKTGEMAGDYKTAFKYHKLATEIKDSLFSSEKNQIITEMGAKYETQTKEREIEVLTRDKALSNILIEKQKKEKWMLWGVASIFLCFGGIIFRSYKVKSKDNELLRTKNQIIEQQKQQVEHQKLLVEEKNNEVLASITYAKRLQDAILPPLKLVHEHLPESFILYKPKDIVAGDFYWMETAGPLVLFAAADCTGHGVPGAMVSVVCSNALNRTVLEFGITDPGKILNKVRELVIETFDKSESEVKDGMDISLIAFNPETRELSWAGANNPLWIINEESKEIIEIKGDKQPVGATHAASDFTTHKVNLSEKDTIYLFTDGYVDQFGGDRGKKFKTAAFRELLLSIVHLSTKEQKEVIEDAFEKWKGDLEQVDDVCVTGIKIL